MYRSSQVECQYADKIEALSKAMKETNKMDSPKLIIEMEKVLKEFIMYRQGSYKRYTVSKELSWWRGMAPGHKG